MNNNTIHLDGFHFKGEAGKDQNKQRTIELPLAKPKPFQGKNKTRTSKEQ